MSWLSCIFGLPFIVAGALANWSFRWFWAGWVYSREFWK